MLNKKVLVHNLINSGAVYFSLTNPTFDGCAGCIYKNDEKTLFFPVMNKYIKGTDIHNFIVRMGFKDDQYILVKGELIQATSQEDIAYVLKELLKDPRWDSESAEYAIFDKRNNKPRKNQFKLVIKSITLHTKESARN